MSVARVSLSSGVIISLSSCLCFAQTQATVDLRNLISRGVGEMRVDLGDTHGGWQVHSVADVNGDGFDEILQIQYRGGRCCIDQQPFNGFGVAWLVFGGTDRERFSGRPRIASVAGTRLDYFHDGPAFSGICDDAVTALRDLDGDGFNELAMGFCFRSRGENLRNTGEVLISVRLRSDIHRWSISNRRRCAI